MTTPFLYGVDDKKKKNSFLFNSFTSKVFPIANEHGYAWLPLKCETFKSNMNEIY